MKVEILGVGVDKLTLAQAVQRCQAFIASGEPHLVVTPNAEQLYAASQDPAIQALLNGADLRVPDGIGVVMASKWVGDPVPERVAGVDLVEGLLRSGSYRVYVFGSTPEAAEGAAKRLQELFPGTEAVGFHHGFFTEAEEPELAAAVRAAKPDLLLCGLGFPKQERFLAKYLTELNVPMAVGIGGGIDVWAGRVDRAPAVYRQVGLEWLWRIVKFRRFARALSLPRFVWAVVRSRGRR